jgi:hypothetical protein
MKTKLGDRLQPLRLWDKFAGLIVYLELNLEGELKRFVIFVRHPQSFFYAKRQDPRIDNWRRRHGRIQDRALEVAALLGRISIPMDFYEKDPRLLQNLCVPRWLTKLKDEWKGNAATELLRAFPGANLSPLRSCLPIKSKWRPTTASAEDRKVALNISRVWNVFKPSGKDQGADEPNDLDDRTMVEKTHYEAIFRTNSRAGKVP